MFANPKAIITGAGRSIGRAIALALAKEGVDIVFSYTTNQTGAAQTADAIKSLGRQVAFYQADFMTNKGVDRFFQQAKDFFGPAGLLVNNAGMSYSKRFLDVSPNSLHDIFQLNVVAPVYLTQQFAKMNIDAGLPASVVNISSIAGTATFDYGSGYAASKSALNKFTENLAVELAPHHIRVNAVCPGIVEAGMNANTAKNNPTNWQRKTSRIPMGRVGQPEDISGSVVFLLSDKASWITGKILEVDGGHTLSCV